MPLLSIAIALHALAAVVWVGGMAFAYGCLRPVAGRALQTPDRLALWQGVFARFFPIVWVAIGLLLVSGYYMTLGPLGGFATVGAHIHVMQAIGLLMMALFAHLFFAPWRRFRRAVERDEPEAAAGELERIRRRVAVNLVLGLIVVIVGSSGRYW